MAIKLLTIMQSKQQSIKYNQQQKMNNRIAIKDQFQYFPLEQLQKIVLHDKNSSKRITTKKLLNPKNIYKHHSKSLYYQTGNPTRNPKHSPVSILNNTGANLVTHNLNQQTLNEQIMGRENPKPHTSDIKSGRLAYLDRNAELKSNKISLRNSGNYNRLASVAGVMLNQEEAQYRMESCIYSKNNVRKNKHKEIEKENKKIAQRLNSQQSQYSTKKLQQQYETQQKISKRLTESKVSKRSNQSIDNRSIYSDHSSRASVRSGGSRHSSTSSMKSTSRMNSSDSARKQGPNRFLAKLQPSKKIKIVQHNINKMDHNDLSKFKNLFANSFTTKNTNYHTQNTNQLINKKHLNSNPYVDIEILSQKSETSAKKQKSVQKDSLLQSINNSNRKLKELNMEQLKVNIPKDNSQSMGKKSSVINSDGLLHRIVEEMYEKKSNDDLVFGAKGKKGSNSTTKTTNPEVRGEKLNSAASRNNNRKKAMVKDELKTALFGANQIFTGKF